MILPRSAYLKRYLWNEIENIIYYIHNIYIKTNYERKSKITFDTIYTFILSTQYVSEINTFK